MTDFDVPRQILRMVCGDGVGEHCLAGAFVNDVTTIPSSASELTLSEGTHAHVPEVPPTYTLPVVSDTTVTHIVFLSVNMANTSSFLFQDSDGNTVVPSLSGGDPAVGDFWQFMCEYSILQGEVDGSWIQGGLDGQENIHQKLDCEEESVSAIWRPSFEAP